MPAIKPKVAILSIHSCPLGKAGGKDTGGMSVYLRETAKKLGEKGFTLDIFTRSQSAAEKSLVQLFPGGRLIRLEAGGKQQLNKLQVYHHLDEFNNNLEDFRSRYQLDYDLIFSHYWLSGWAGLKLQTLWHTPHVMMFHTLGASKSTYCTGENEPKLRLEAEKTLALKCTRLIAPTEKEKNELIAHTGVSLERISIIPCGVDTELFKPLDKIRARRKLGYGQEKVILFVGRIEPVKGLERLLYALSHLKGNMLRLVIVGGDNQSHKKILKLKSLVKKLQIKGPVDFLGLVDHNMLPLYYNAADACALVSYYESFGLVGLEALACGTPLIATDVGVLNNVVEEGKTGVLLESGCSPEYMAEKISLLFNNYANYNAEKIRKSIIQYSWPYITNQIEEMLIKEIAAFN